MSKMFFRWVMSALGLLAVAYLVPGFDVDSIWVALISAMILGLVNVFIRPLLVILTLPVSVVTLGLFLVVINALMLWLTASLIPGFQILNFVTAVLGAIILWIVSVGTEWIIKNNK